MTSVGPNRSKWFIIASNVGRNWWTKARHWAGKPDASIGVTHRNWTVDHSIKYINQVFEDYLHYGNLSIPDLAGRTVLELGPGDNLGVALRFLAAGAARVVCVDKFLSRRDPQREKEVYLRLRSRLNKEEQDRFDAAIDVGDRCEPIAPRLVYAYGCGIENAAELLDGQQFDVIVSRAVLMEIHPLEQAFRVLDGVLAPGGRMIHKIAPLHDYTLFSSHGFHPLEFLTIPDVIYTQMAADSGKPNRYLASYYSSKLRELRYDVQVQITGILGVKDTAVPSGTTELQYGVHYDSQLRSLVQNIRPRLVHRLREVPEQDLLTEHFFSVAIKQPIEAQREPTESYEPSV